LVLYNTNKSIGSDILYYSEALARLNRDLKDKQKLEKRIAEKKEELKKAQQDYVNLLNAQKLLSTVSDDNTESTLLFVSGVINKALAEIFKGDTRRIFLSRKLYGGSKPHIVVELENGKGERLDMSIQSGTGLRQIVSVLFVICLIEVRKGRRLLILDERLSGLHSEAKRILSEIIKIFSEGGFQFIFVEYSLNTLGKLYNVEKPGNEAKVYALDGVEYSNDDVFLFSDVDLSLLDNDYIEE
jgi:DNA repair exonuclease SbcCD ATPase subunit